MQPTAQTRPPLILLPRVQRSILVWCAPDTCIHETHAHLAEKVTLHPTSIYLSSKVSQLSAFWRRSMVLSAWFLLGAFAKYHWLLCAICFPKKDFLGKIETSLGDKVLFVLVLLLFLFLKCISSSRKIHAYWNRVQSNKKQRWCKCRVNYFVSPPKNRGFIGVTASQNVNTKSYPKTLCYDIHFADSLSFF